MTVPGTLPALPPRGKLLALDVGLARIGVAIVVGTQQRERPVDRDRLFSLLGEYQRWVRHAMRST